MTDTEPDLPSSWAADDAEAASSPPRWPWILGGAFVVLVAVGIAVVVLNRDDAAPKEWPDLGGRPAGLGERDQSAADVTPDVAPGVYVWNDFDGWHLWVVNGDGVDGASGTITSGDDMPKGELSLPDGGTVTVDGKVTTFDLVGDVPLTGVDFEPGFYAEEITIDVDGVEPSKVMIGRDPADSMPVTIEKVERSDDGSG